MAYRILVADDEPGIRQVLKECLRGRFEVTTAEDGLEARREIETQDFDVIVLDIHMPGLTGLDIYQWMEEEKPEAAARTFFITCVSSYPSYQSFARIHKDRCFSKPFMIDQLVDRLNRFLDRAGERASISL